MQHFKWMLQRRQAIYQGVCAPTCSTQIIYKFHETYRDALCRHIGRLNRYWSSQAQYFLVSGPIRTDDHIFLFKTIRFFQMGFLNNKWRCPTTTGDSHTTVAKGGDLRTRVEAGRWSTVEYIAAWIVILGSEYCRTHGARGHILLSRLWKSCNCLSNPREKSRNRFL
jgi:hypothetical protein